MITVRLGNTAPRQAYNPHKPGTFNDLGLTIEPPAPGTLVDLDPLVHHTTTVILPDGIDLGEAVATVEQLWPHHSGDAPGWVTVEGLDPVTADSFASVLRYHLGMPPAPTGPVALVVNSGLDYAVAQLFGAASATNVATWIGITANSTPPAGGDTSLTGEIATASGGLIRAQAALAHTTGATTCTLTKTFTANGFDVLPVTAAKAALFDRSAAGTMVLETLISPTATFTASGDNMPLTWTVTV